MEFDAVFTIAVITLVAILLQWLAWWVKLPAILFLLLFGIVAGPVTGLVNPDLLFGNLLTPIVSLAVAVVLFEGGLTLKLTEIKGLAKVVRNLLTVGLLTTWVITAFAVKYLLDFSWEMAFLFGSFTVVTGPTVIVPMLRTVRPNAKISNILRWEGIVIDPVGALLAVLVFEFIVSESTTAAWGHTVLLFGSIILTGLFAGIVAGHLFGLALRNHLLPEYLHNVAALAIVWSVFAFSNAAAEESGLLAVTVMGMWLANMKGTPVDQIIDFKESLSVLLISILFITLAARLEFSQFNELGMAAFVVFLVMQFIARPIKVLISSIGSSLTWAERALLSWIAPRGIVAAAVSAMFALRLEETGTMEKADLLVPLTFAVIIGTVVLQSATAGPLARWLKVAEPDPKGFLVIGANAVSRAVAKALLENEFRTLLCDTNWENIKKARMEGHNTYYGSPVSEHADRNLDLVGIGKMLGLSPLPNLNALASMKYRNEFGYKAIYSIRSKTEIDLPEKRVVAAESRGRPLFGDKTTYSSLANQIAQGAEVRSTSLTESFDYEEYLKQYEERAIPLFAINPKGQLEMFVAGGSLKPLAGWTIAALVIPEKNEE